MNNKIALVLEGGGLRGIFTAGVIDCFLENNLNFDYVVGVSAGACNTFGFLGKAHSFNKNCMIQDDARNRFFGITQMLESHKFVDLEKVFYDYADYYEFDNDTFLNNSTKWEMVVSNIETGRAEYLCSHDLEKAKRIGLASCSLPFFSDIVEIDGKKYLDGGVCDSIPIQRALDLGYEKVVVVCTRIKGSYSSIDNVQQILFERFYNKYPVFIDAAKRRTDLYKNQIEQVENLEQAGKVFLIRPTLKEVSRLENDNEELLLSYYHGYTKTRMMMKSLNEFIK